MLSKREFRYLKNPIELRESPDGKATISGYAVVFAPAKSEDLGGFVEQVHADAVKSALSADVRALFNHDANFILARTASRTLMLSVDEHGLKYEFEAPDTTAGRDLVTSMKRGDIDGSSFGFVCNKDSWDKVNGQMVRTLLDVSVFDVSPVTFPAYPDASSQVRSLFPDGKPEIPEPVATEQRSAECECDCPECEAGNCDGCTDPDCNDPECRCEQRALKAQLEMRLCLAKHGKF